MDQGANQSKQHEIVAQFDTMAEGYDAMWKGMGPLYTTLHQLIGAMLGDISETARVLSVGTGTGNEILVLARQFPSWQFTLVDPSTNMLEVFQGKAEQAGIASRCTLHAGYVETLPESAPFDASLALLVSQFFMDNSDRTAFFHSIVRRLVPGGLFVNSDLCGEMGTARYGVVSEAWWRLMRRAGIPEEKMDAIKAVYGKHVSIRPRQEIEMMLRESGLQEPVQFYQAGLLRGWCSLLPLEADTAP